MYLLEQSRLVTEHTLINSQKLIKERTTNKILLHSIIINVIKMNV